MNLRHLSYLVSLARERNFRRAADASHITQPTLSAALRQLEAEFGVPLVRRTRQRFDGFTKEGDRVLEAARRMLADADVLRQSLKEPEGHLTGHLRIGIIPTAEPFAGQITALFHARQPKVTITLLSKTSREIKHGILEHALEAGVTYIENVDEEPFSAQPLYSETYVVMGSERLFGQARASMTWNEASRLPLVLLNQEMRNRRLIDEAFAKAGVVPKVMAESSTLVGIFSHVRNGAWCGIVPEAFAALLGPVADLRSLALTDPDVAHPVGVLTLGRKPQPPLAKALIDVLLDVRTFGERPKSRA